MQDPKPRPDDGQSPDPGAPTAPKNAEERLRIIRAAVEDIKAAVRQDGGDITLASIEGDIVRVRLAGACMGCSSAAQTLGGLRRKIMALLNEPVRVLPALSDQ